MRLHPSSILLALVTLAAGTVHAQADPALALEPVGGSAEQFTQQMKQDHRRYGALARELNMPKVD